MKLQLSDGIHLAVKTYETEESPKAMMIIVHGLAEYKGRYEYVASTLQRHGYQVICYDQRGHGDSEGEPIYFDGAEKLFDDLHEVVNWAKEEYKDLPLYILGHSMGGFATAGFAIKYPRMADGFILSGAMSHNSENTLKPIPPWVPGKLRVHGNLAGLQAHKISRDPWVVKAYEKDPKVSSYITTGLARSFYDGVQYIGRHVENFEDPVLILHGGADKLVSPEDSRWLYQSISSKDKELIVYEGLYHEILNEPEKDKILKDIIYWLDERQG